MTLFEIGNKIMFFTETSIRCGTIIGIEENCVANCHAFILETGTALFFKKENNKHKGCHALIKIFDKRVFDIVEANIDLMKKLEKENIKYFIE